MWHSLMRTKSRSGRRKGTFVRYGRYVPAAAVMITIFILSSRTGDQMDSWLPWAQKWVPFLTDFNPMHYVAYFGLALALAFGLGRLSFTWPGCIANVAICVVYGLTDELEMTSTHLGMVCTGIDMTVTDVRGKKFRLQATPHIGAPWIAAPTAMVHNALMRWTCAGREGYGVVMSTRHLSELNRKFGRFQAETRGLVCV